MTTTDPGSRPPLSRDEISAIRANAPRDSDTPRRDLYGLLKSFLVILAAFWFVVEAVLWTHLLAALKRFACHPATVRLEARVAALSPGAALALFLLPQAAILPFKLAALWMIVTGNVIAGGFLFAVLKVFGVALWAWLFALCSQNLLSVLWFRHIHDAVLELRAAIFASAAERPAWQMGRTLLSRLCVALRPMASWLAARGPGLLRRLHALRCRISGR